MRSVLGLVGLLVAAAVALLLFARDARKSVRAVNAPIPALREDVAPRAFDREAIEAALVRLGELLDADPLPGSELAAIRASAAAWVAGTRPGTGEYRCALKVRETADALLAASRGDEARRNDARRTLREAREALANPAGMPGGAVGGVRDQLENLQQSQRERLEDTEQQTP